MSQEVLFLSCIVADHNSEPFTGMHVSLTCLSSSAQLFEGRTDSTGQVLQWHRIHGSDPKGLMFWVPGFDGTCWRMVFDTRYYLAADHPFPSISVDLQVTSCRGRSVTILISPESYMVYNSPRGRVNQGTAPHSGPYVSDNFPRSDQVPLRSDARSHSTQGNTVPMAENNNLDTMECSQTSASGTNVLLGKRKCEEDDDNTEGRALKRHHG